MHAEAGVQIRGQGLGRGAEGEPLEAHGRIRHVLAHGSGNRRMTSCHQACDFAILDTLQL